MSAVTHAQDPPPSPHCRLKVSLASKAGAEAGARNAAP